ncbi:Hypothetical protein R9X50_00407700 [Acrodontium crateriforme]|uniref:Uncharacterized protein n=1 Tax=Acrodontium crateriforme TaxID=150365 RepID=A0AAQ3M4N8_9PEZI|nr:Hypothetical protein R9X50_00407700 [Acrodontium crateriforme]
MAIDSFHVICKFPSNLSAYTFPFHNIEGYRCYTPQRGPPLKQVLIHWKPATVATEDYNNLIQCNIDGHPLRDMVCCKMKSEDVIKINWKMSWQDVSTVSTSSVEEFRRSYEAFNPNPDVKHQLLLGHMEGDQWWEFQVTLASQSHMKGLHDHEAYHRAVGGAIWFMGQSNPEMEDIDSDDETTIADGSIGEERGDADDEMTEDGKE